MVHLDYRDARPIYVQIMDGLKHQITAGVLQQGAKLPSVRELAMELSINPNTIQRSYRQLEAEGWIVTVPGKGCFVCKADHSQEERERLLIAFDETCSALFRVGVTAVELAKRLETGGK